MGVDVDASVNMNVNDDIDVDAVTYVCITVYAGVDADVYDAVYMNRNVYIEY